MDKLKSLWARLNQDTKDIWNQDKVFFFVAGILILIVKFREIIISLLLDSAKNEENKAEQKDDQLKQQENQANQQANVLVQQAQQEPQKEEPVDKDWYKKEDK